ncbi:MAG: hypothetical protein JSV36_19725 [Anaerolineae bacterium]|nr:MAG: hypothetical protein JSV36_19725 [Anaerolineae bacterium]
MWKLLTELELWWLDVQLGGFPALPAVALVAVGIVVGYLSLSIVMWRSRVDFAREMFGSARLFFPVPVVRFRAVVAGALILMTVQYLWR